MKIYLASFGKPSKNIGEEIAKYIKRLNGLVETTALKTPASFENRFPGDKFARIVLSEEGKLLSTVQLAEWMRPRLSKSMVFLVGPAYGLEPETKQRADLLLSLSPLTFSCEHAFLLLAEQVYRCLMVLRGHPYHHANQ